MPDLEDLFPYAHAYHTTYGIDQAANQVLRTSLQSLSNAQMNKIIGSRIVSETEFLAAVKTGKLDLGFKGKVRAAAKLLGEPRLARALIRMQSNMEGARRLYAEYPEDPSQLPAWRKRTGRLFANI